MVKNTSTNENQNTLLFEIYSEEIPATLQKNIAIEYEKIVKKLLIVNKINNVENLIINIYISPCRLILVIENVILSNIADERNLEKNNLITFLKQTIIQLQKNKSALPRLMKWDNSGLQWIRPIRNILCLLSYEILEFEFFNFKSNNKTFGNKQLSLSNKKELYIENYNDYCEQLKDNFVIFNQNERYDLIKSYVKQFEKKYSITLYSSEKLIEEISGLLEFPIAIECEIPEKFLTLPKEVISLILEKNQRYLMFDSDNGNKLSKYFLIIAEAKNDDNIETKLIYDNIKNGNLKVVNARLEDGLFYWEKDLKLSVSELNERLKNITFSDNLSQYEFFYKMKNIATNLSLVANNDSLKYLLNYYHLDLATYTVNEFPELHGIIFNYLIKIWLNDLTISLDSFNKIQLVYNYIYNLCYINEMWLSGNKPTSSGDPYNIKSKVYFLIKNNLNFASKFLNLENWIDSKVIKEVKLYILDKFCQYVIDENENNPTLQQKELVSKYKKFIGINFDSIGDLEQLFRLSNFNNDWQTLNFENFLKLYKRIVNFKSEKCDESEIKDYIYNIDEKKILKIIQFEGTIFDAGNIAIITNYLDNTMINSDNEIEKKARLNLLNKIIDNFNCIIPSEII